MAMDNAIHDAKRLKELQALPLERKIMITQTRIIEWYQHYNGNVVVSFSGGKDSTVLLHIARQLYPDIPAVFSNTGLEYPEIQSFVREHENVKIVRPKMQFSEVISKYGYPLIGKEVAEAIYYARRISPSAQRERDAERESHSDELRGKPPYRADGCNAVRHTHTHTQQGENERNSPENGVVRDAHDKRGNQPRTQNRGDRKWGDYRRRCLHPDKKDERDKECFYNRRAGVDEEYGSKSQFNKEKYLPLARDIPVPISHYCCQVMKKQPLKQFQKQVGLYPILATLAEESRVRKQGWIRTGCNAFDGANPKSQPMSFWTEQDILSYLIKYDVPIASVYGEIVAFDEEGNEYSPKHTLTDCKLKCTGCERTGCIFCAFGFHNEKGETRFQRLAKTHPRQYEYCIGGGQWVDNPHYDPTAPEYDGEWKNWNPKKIWTPSKQGLGMGKVFDMVNEIYGKDFYRYE